MGEFSIETMESGGAGRSLPPDGPVPTDFVVKQRAHQRLRIAARLLRGDGIVIDDALGFHAGVIAAIASLSEQKRAKLRGNVDWVEAYENA